MIYPHPHRIIKEGVPYNYLQFDSVTNLRNFVSLEFQRLSYENSKVWSYTRKLCLGFIKNNPDWFGEPVPEGLYQLENHNSFTGMHLIKEVEPEIRKHLKRYLNYTDQNLLTKPRLAYNDKRIGIFSFDRASTGLYKQYYLNKETPVDQVLTKVQIELEKPDIKTSTKKAYAFFQDKNISYPSIRIFLLAGGNSNIKGKAILYVGIACCELVEFLELRGIPVEVNVLIGSEFDSQVCLSVVRLKRFQDKIDKNKLLLSSSDPRYFRYQGFKVLIAHSNYFELIIPQSLGSIAPSIGKDFVNALDINAFVFEQSYSLESVTKEVVRIIDEYHERLRKKRAA